MDTAGLIIQGWHIVGFVVCFISGGFFTTSFLMPFVDKFEKWIEENENSD